MSSAVVVPVDASLQVVPTFADPRWTQATTVDGSTYQLTFSYNQRCACYYLDVSDLEGNPIYLGVKMICESPLLRKCADDRAPPGDFWVASLTGDLAPPTLGELGPGGRCVLLYIPVALIP